VISKDSSLLEIAAIVSEMLQTAGIEAILGGGGAVAQYSDNEYMTTDLDFITYEQHKILGPAMAKLGFKRAQGRRHYEHSKSDFYVEFPPGPLSFGDRSVDNNKTATLQTKHGALRIITPTQCLMDRLVWYVHGNDRQSRDQAVMVAKRQDIDWDAVFEWAESDGIDIASVEQIREEASRLS